MIEKRLRCRVEKEAKKSKRRAEKRVKRGQKQRREEKQQRARKLYGYSANESSGR